MSVNIIDSFFVALGYKIDDKELKSFQGQVESAKESVVSWGTALTGFISGIALHKIAEIGSTFEQNQIQIAGFLDALEVAPGWDNAWGTAADVIQQITKDAAVLPGEAEEYIEVFKAGLPYVQKAMPGGSLQEMTDFTNKLTAIGKTFGLDAGLISREFDHMLSPDKGMASLRLPLFRQLLPFMKQVEGQSKLTAQSFNQMTEQKRLQLLQSTFTKLQPMLDASANSFDAMWGTLVSAGKLLVRIGSEGLFKGMKKAIGDLSAQFVDSDGKLTKTGKDVADVMARIGKVIGSVLTAGIAFVKWLANNNAAAQTLKMTLLVLAGVVGGLGAAVFLVAQDLWGFFNGMDSVTGDLVEQFQPAIVAVIALLGGLALAFSPVLTAVGLLIIGAYEFQKHWKGAIDWVQDHINGMVDTLNMLIDKVNVVITAFGASGIGHVAHRDYTTWKRETREPQALQDFKSNWRSGNDDTPSWLMPRGAAAGAGGNTTVTHGPVRIGDINITTPDAKASGKAVQSVLRNAQSGIKR